MSSALTDELTAIRWTAVCDQDRVRLDRGVAALVDGRQVAIFRLGASAGEQEQFYAVSNIDPVTGAPVMARGLVGSAGEAPLMIPIVISPIHKERYNLRTGYRLGGEGPRLEVFDVRLVDGSVEVGLTGT